MPRMGDPASWSDDQAAFEALLVERKVVELPHPPIVYPDWMKVKDSAG
jgi:hypothetical protein